jgi:hypothetical protein
MIKTPLVILFVGLGIVFWLVGVLMVRFLGPLMLIPDNPLMIVAYLACFPLLFVTLLISSAVSRLPIQDMLEPMVIMTFSAVFIDGVVMGWLPQVYGDDMEAVARGAAWILWGGAVGLFCAWIFARRAPRTSL